MQRRQERCSDMAEEKFVPNFKKKYTETVAPQLMKDFGFKSFIS